MSFLGQNQHQGILLVGLFLFMGMGLMGQTSQIPITIGVTPERVVLDGKLDDPAWKQAQSLGPFTQQFPADTGLASQQTILYLTYDDRFLYAGFKCYSIDNRYSQESLRRDFRGSATDGVTLIFDTFRDRTNAFAFSLSPKGVQREALISNGGDDFSVSWDNRWFSAAEIYEGYWIGEVAIPLKTLRYKKGATSWYFNAYRLDAQSNERSTWQPVPLNQNIFNLAFGGEIAFEDGLPKPGANFSLIPYVGLRMDQNFLENKAAEWKFTAGGDAKIGITPALNLDLTVLPDFSQVEVDQQRVNLDRFELFFPERRQFFLENADLFSEFGYGRTRPFFSRRIGVARDTATGQNIQNDIPFGVRLSGKVNDNLRIGLLNMQTSAIEESNVPSYNYSVAVAQHKLFARSNISAIFVNKMTLQDSTNGEFSFQNQHYNRVAGVDFNPATKDNKLSGKLYLHKSFTDGVQGDDFSHGFNLRYNVLRWDIQYLHRYVGSNFNAETGFVPRVGVFQIQAEVQHYFSPRSVINRHGPGIEYRPTWTNGYGLTDEYGEIKYRFFFDDTGFLSIGGQYFYTYLFNEFDPSGLDSLPLPADTEYRYSRAFIFYRGDDRKAITYEFSTNYGSYFNGLRWNVRGELTFRFRPILSLGVNVNYNRIRLPDPYPDSDLILIGPRIDLTLTRSVFFSLFTQYNSQIDNININARFQWRFAPVSDLFIVYTDNYSASEFAPKTRGLVFKLTYWLNI